MITIERYNDNFLTEWEEIVHSSNNGTLFHTRKFLSYHSKDKFIDHSLIFYKNNKPLSVFPAVEKTESHKKILVSHPGASMGSFVTPADLSFSDSLQLVDQLNLYLKKQKFSRAKITLPPIIYNQRKTNYIDYSLLRSGYKYVKREVSSILFLEDSIEKNVNKFKPSHRQALRKAQRSGLVVNNSDDFNSFYRILKKNLNNRHNVKPTHSIDELLKLKKLFPKNILLHAAFLNNKMIGGIINFVANKNVILAFYISHDENYQEHRPINLLFYEILKDAIKNNFKVFDFGIFTVNEEPNMGLAKFKENFGSSGIFRDTVILDF
ncbi:GNAT family N-acetyltransferase [Candidatus Marinimicrobia bacterium]|nr:GNAT family N-acetyltransferase [Candidatus Neomarinimicrobiota bacterium]